MMSQFWSYNLQILHGNRYKWNVQDDNDNDDDDDDDEDETNHNRHWECWECQEWIKCHICSETQAIN